MASQQTPPTSIKGASCGFRSLAEYNESRMKGVFMPNSPLYDASLNARCQSSSLIGDAGEQSAGHPLINSSVDAVDGMQVVKLVVSVPISMLVLVFSAPAFRHDTDFFHGYAYSSLRHAL